MHIIDQINQKISQYDLLKHPFYQAWSKGELTLPVLQDYAAQYYHAAVKSFPRAISYIHTHCPDIEARKVLLENLVDEELHGTDHPELWMQFATGLGCDRQAVLDAALLSESVAMRDVFFNLTDNNWQQGLCALYAYECQVPEVSASKIEGLKTFYNIDDEKTLAFFTEHLAYDVEHSQQIAGLIEKHVEPQQALAAADTAAAAFWKFLDGICHKHAIHC